MQAAIRILHTKNLVLTELDANDASAVFELFSDAELMSFMDDELHKSIKDAENFIEKHKANDSLFYSIRLKSTGQSVGLIGLYDFNKKHHFANCKFITAKAYHRKGFLLEALNVFIPHVFQNTSIHRIEAQVHINNIKIQKFLSRFGFKQEGIIRENFIIDGKYYDSIMFSLLQEDIV